MHKFAVRYYLHHLCVSIQSEQFQASFTSHFGLNISGSLLKTKQRMWFSITVSHIIQKKKRDEIDCTVSK